MKTGILEYLMIGCVFCCLSCRSHDDNDDDDDDYVNDYDMDCTMVNPDDETACLAQLCAAQAVYRACEGPATYCYRMESCYEEFYIEFTWYCPVDGNLQPDLQPNYDEVDAEYQTCLADAEDDGVADSDDPIVPYNGPDPFAEFDCEVAGLDETTCDFQFCADQYHFNEIFYHCQAEESVCESSWQCTLDYFHCFLTACPSGTLYVDIDLAVQNACSTAWYDCLYE